jgi:SH3 domain protein
MLVPALVHAQSATRQQYISDDITVTLREQPRNDAAPVGALKSGARVTVLQSLGPESFARVRTADGREGWLTTRYLSPQPAVKERFQQTREALDGAQSRIENLERELRAAQQQLSLAQPAFQAVRENERLQTAMAELQHSSAGLKQRYDEERARRRTLLSGGGLVLLGVILGLVLPLLRRGRKRRYSEF